MKLTLQLVVVVLNAPTKFRDNLFKFTLYTIIIYKVRDTRCHLCRHAPFQHNFFHEIRTPKENKCQDRRNRIAPDIETNEAFPHRETNHIDFDKLERYNPKRPTTCSPGQINVQPRK